MRHFHKNVYIYGLTYLLIRNWCHSALGIINKVQLSRKPRVSNTLTAARRVRALRPSLSWVFVRGYLPCDDDINEASGCDRRLSMSPKLLFDAGLWGLRSLILDPDARALRVSWVGLASWQRHSTIWWLHGSSLCLLLLLLGEAGCPPSCSRWRHVTVPFVFALLHLSHIHLWGRGCSVHQCSQSIGSSAVARAALYWLCCCCWMGPDVERKKWWASTYFQKDVSVVRHVVCQCHDKKSTNQTNIARIGLILHYGCDDTLALENTWPLLNHNILCPKRRRRGVKITSTPWPAWLLWSTWHTHIKYCTTASKMKFPRPWLSVWKEYSNIQIFNKKNEPPRMYSLVRSLSRSRSRSRNSRSRSRSRSLSLSRCSLSLSFSLSFSCCSRSRSLSRSLSALAAAAAARWAGWPEERNDKQHKQRN